MPLENSTPSGCMPAPAPSFSVAVEVGLLAETPHKNAASRRSRLHGLAGKMPLLDTRPPLYLHIVALPGQKLPRQAWPRSARMRRLHNVYHLDSSRRTRGGAVALTLQSSTEPIDTKVTIFLYGRITMSRARSTAMRSPAFAPRCSQYDVYPSFVSVAAAGSSCQSAD